MLNLNSVSVFKLITLKKLKIFACEANELIEYSESANLNEALEVDETNDKAKGTSCKSIYKPESYLAKQEIIQRCCTYLRTECLCIRGGGGFLLDNKVYQDCLVSGKIFEN